MSRRDRLVLWLPGIVALSVALFAVLIITTSGGGRLGKGPTFKRQPGELLAGSTKVDAWTRGLPQQGAVIGSATAPVRLVEFIDPQCPYCRRSLLEDLPPLLQGPVRRGELSVRLRVLTFLGDDSGRLATTFWQAAARGRFWQTALIAYANQGEENSGWATDAFRATLLRAGGAAGAPATPGAAQAIAADKAAAQAQGVSSTPTSFVVGPHGTKKLKGPKTAGELRSAIAAVA